MIPRPPRSTRVRSSAASDVYKRQVLTCVDEVVYDPNEFESNIEETTVLPEGHCTTNGDVYGKCVSRDVCYPYAAYLIDNDKLDLSSALQDNLNSTEPCAN